MEGDEEEGRDVWKGNRVEGVQACKEVEEERTGRLHRGWMMERGERGDGRNG